MTRSATRKRAQREEKEKVVTPSLKKTKTKSSRELECSLCDTVYEDHMWIVCGECKKKICRPCARDWCLESISISYSHFTAGRDNQVVTVNDRGCPHCRAKNGWDIAMCIKGNKRVCLDCDVPAVAVARPDTVNQHWIICPTLAAEYAQNDVNKGHKHHILVPSQCLRIQKVLLSQVPGPILPMEYTVRSLPIAPAYPLSTPPPDGKEEKKESESALAGEEELTCDCGHKIISDKEVYIQLLKSMVLDHLRNDCTTRIPCDEGCRFSEIKEDGKESAGRKVQGVFVSFKEYAVHVGTHQDLRMLAIQANTRICENIRDPSLLQNRSVKKFTEKLFYGMWNPVNPNDLYVNRTQLLSFLVTHVMVGKLDTFVLEDAPMLESIIKHRERVDAGFYSDEEVEDEGRVVVHHVDVVDGEVDSDSGSGSGSGSRSVSTPRPRRSASMALAMP
jgi:hypothetical protein